MTNWGGEEVVECREGVVRRSFLLLIEGIKRKGRGVDAWAQDGEEGRGKLRKATGSCKRALIRGYPNGGTRPG